MTRARDFANLAGGITASDVSGLSARNLIINGAMQVAQRGDVALATNHYGGPDRFKFVRTGNCHVTLSQDALVPTGYGFNKSLKIDVTQTPQGVQASDTAQVFQTIEAQNLDSAKKGTSSAEKLTLSFWVRSRNAGTYIAELYDHVNSRHINKAYTISTTNTWQRQVITFEGDTTGALVAGAAAGIQVGWWLLGGNDFQSGTLQTSWGAATSANRAVGQTNAVNSTLNTFFLTGVQLEVGEQATAFEHEDYGTTLRKCQRYYFKLTVDTSADSFCTGACDTSTGVSANGTLSFPVTMRDSPTAIETSGTAGDYQIRSKGQNKGGGSVPTYLRATKDTAYIQFAGASGLTHGAACTLRSANNNAFLAWSSEL